MASTGIAFPVVGIGDDLRDPGNGFGCFVLYPESGQAFWSNGLYRLLGLPPRSGSESAPPSYVDVFFARVHPDDRDRVREGHARLAAEGIVVDTTYRIVRLDGATLLVRASGAVTMVYGIVKQHAGFVRVRSAKREGSTFEVYLPAVEGQPEPATAPRRTQAPLSGTVLVVEDTDPLRAILCRILEDAGLVVHAAGSGDEAIRVLNRLGAVDVIMPGMSGCDLAREVARIAPAAQVVFMSGYVDAALLARIEQSAPGRPLVHKPFDREELLGVLSVALSDRAGASS